MDKKKEEKGSGIFPHSIDFIVTSKCNLHCPVCWSSYMPEYKALPLDDQFEVIRILNKGGVRKAVFTGGEPLLEEDLGMLVAEANALGMEILLFTNGILMDEDKIHGLMPYVHYISLPLDGADEKTNKIARGRGHFNKVLNVIELLKSTYRERKVQVLTLVTAVNKDRVREIGELLEEKTKDMKFHWKLNHYKPIGRFNEKFMLDYNEFEQIAKGIKQEFEGRLKVRYNIPEHDMAYLFIFPDGNMYSTKSSTYTLLGNVLEPKSYDRDALREIEQNMLETSFRVKGKIQESSI